MSRARRFLLFFSGTALLGIVWISGIILVMGAGHFNDLSPTQVEWFEWFQWWVLLAPPCVVGSSAVLIFDDDIWRRLPKRHLWLYAVPFLGAALIFLVSWCGVRLILSAG